MENKDKKPMVIDLAVLFKKVKEHKKAFFITLPVVFILSSLIIICVPRTYTSSTTMAPEMSGASGTSTISELASSFGFDLSNVEGTDAISPLLYPDLMSDNGFVSNLFNIKIQTIDGTVKTTYRDYLLRYQNHAWWDVPIEWLKNLFKSKDKGGNGGKKEFDPYQPTKREELVMDMIRNSVGIAIDKKTGIISISTESQDPLVCKIIADSTRAYIQEFITKYRTSKARRDVQYYEKLTAKARADYQRARQLYGSYSDANSEVILESYKSKIEDLENEMQLKYNAYNAYTTQLQAAQAKLQERTPAFTVIKGASVPLKPSGPKRMIFVLAMTFIAFVILTLYSLKDIILSE